MIALSETTWKRIGMAVAGLVVLGFVLFAADRCSTYWSNKKAEKLKANVNTAINAVKAAETDTQADDIDRAVKVEQLKVAVQEAVNASTATDEARNTTNAALANLANAINANRPTGTTETDLERQLDGLGIK